MVPQLRSSQRVYLLGVVQVLLLLEDVIDGVLHRGVVDGFADLVQSREPFPEMFLVLDQLETSEAFHPDPRQVLMREKRHFSRYCLE